VLGIVATAVTEATAAWSGRLPSTIGAGVALVALAVWLLLYLRLSAPINRQLTTAAEAGRTLANGRALQAKWDSVINARAVLQGVAVVALCVVLMT
jgi:hypothetical protein